MSAGQGWGRGQTGSGFPARVAVLLQAWEEAMKKGPLRYTLGGVSTSAGCGGVKCRDRALERNILGGLKWVTRSKLSVYFSRLFWFSKETGGVNVLEMESKLTFKNKSNDLCPLCCGHVLSSLLEMPQRTRQIRFLPSKNLYSSSRARY